MQTNTQNSNTEHVKVKGAMDSPDFNSLLLRKPGKIIDAKCIVQLPFVDNQPVFSAIKGSCDDPFLNRIHKSNSKWIIITDPKGIPQYALHANKFLRSAIFAKSNPDPLAFCHRPIIVQDPDMRLGEVIAHLRVHSKNQEHETIDNEIILYWGDEKRLITGADVLNSLLRSRTESKRTDQG